MFTDLITSDTQSCTTSAERCIKYRQTMDDPQKKKIGDRCATLPGCEENEENYKHLVISTLKVVSLNCIFCCFESHFI